MAFLSVLSATTPATALFCHTHSTSSKSSFPNTLTMRPPFNCLMSIRAVKSASCRTRLSVVGMAPEEEKMTRRSPLDVPIEWDRPKPGRRPDIFPQFSPMKTPLPPPMPADPPEEDEEEEEERKEEEEEDTEENPDKPDNDGDEDEEDLEEEKKEEEVKDPDK